jgi:hypothetical protein
MSETAEKSTPKVADVMWKAESLRLTAFPTTVDLDVSTLWGLLGAGPAGQIVQQPALRTSQASGTTKLSGKDVQLSLQVTADRLHYWVNEIPARGPDAHGLLVVGEFLTVLPDFVARAVNLLRSHGFPETKRIAFGAVLLNPVPNLYEGQRQLSNLLPNIGIDPEHSTDVFFQINRPRLVEAGADSLKVNRFSKWSVAQLLRFNVQMVGQNVGAPAGVVSVFATRLEIDIHSDETRTGALPRDFAVDLFPKLVELGVEISERGDVR